MNMTKEQWTVSSVLKAVFLSMSGLGSSTSVMSRADFDNAQLSDRHKTLTRRSTSVPGGLLKQSGKVGEETNEQRILPH